MSDDLVMRLRVSAAWEDVHDAADLIEAQAAEIASLRAALKWNIEKDGDDLLICEGDHERHEGCVMQRWVKADLVATARRDALVEIKQDTDELIEQGRQDGMEYAAQIADSCAADWRKSARATNIEYTEWKYEDRADAGEEIGAAIRAAAKEVK